MPSVSNDLGLFMRILLWRARLAAFVTTPVRAGTHGSLSAEERRWQLEWERRNVED